VTAESLSDVRQQPDATPVRVITVSNPDALTRHNPDAGRQLTDRIWEAAEPDEVKALILDLEGTDDSPVDADGSWTPERGRESALGARQLAYAGTTGLYQTLALCKKPIVAELRGTCRGVASLIALYADLAVADATARFYSPFDTLPEANFAIAVLTLRLDRAKAWLLSGEPLDAQTAEEFGLINQVVPADKLAATSMALAQRIARMPLDGITLSKMNLNACLDAMAVGQEFDLSGYFAAGMASPNLLGVL
jgi:enoyl-CoA hydratase/carnithine racemase